MTNVEDIVERSTIKFPGGLTVEGVRGLSAYLENETPYEVILDVKSSERLRGGVNLSGPRVVSIEGEIRETKARGNEEPFTTYFELDRSSHPESGEAVFTALSFEPRVGFGYETPEEISIWGDVMEATRKYFESQK